MNRFSILCVISLDIPNELQIWTQVTPRTGRGGASCRGFSTTGRHPRQSLRATQAGVPRRKHSHSWFLRWIFLFWRNTLYNAPFGLKFAGCELKT